VIFTTIERSFHNYALTRGVVSCAMRQAYVVKLGSETNPSERDFVGCVEEVDTGRELRFTSTEELLTFLAECFDRGTQEEADSDDPCGGC
jgi:hypothetical protein